jgi:hypothetical protein
VRKRRHAGTARNPTPCASMEGLSVLGTYSFHYILTQNSVQAVLPKSRYYVALGSVVDAALSRVMDDILALSDIPEVESHRLSELCKILHALEGHFVENTTQVSAIFTRPSTDEVTGFAGSLPSLWHMFPHGSSIHTSPNYWLVYVTRPL